MGSFVVPPQDDGVGESLLARHPEVASTRKVGMDGVIATCRVEKGGVLRRSSSG